ncbi:hypothetical protein [Streptomyces albus]|uniref:hypothetical protein n=1 Tax=Streptomyces albus TaxID=1888 RepID=UPI0024E0F8FD|nr:hypothetical protein [Streptomyces albus]
MLPPQLTSHASSPARESSRPASAMRTMVSLTVRRKRVTSATASGVRAWLTLPS